MQAWAVILLQDDKLLFKSEKIFTVLTVVLIIWLGIVALLLSMNKRINKLENQQQKLD